MALEGFPYKTSLSRHRDEPSSLSSEFDSEVLFDRTSLRCRICGIDASQARPEIEPTLETEEAQRKPILHSHTVQGNAFVRPCLCPGRTVHKTCMGQLVIKERQLACPQCRYRYRIVGANMRSKR